VCSAASGLGSGGGQVGYGTESWVVPMTSWSYHSCVSNTSTARAERMAGRGRGWGAPLLRASASPYPENVA